MANKKEHFQVIIDLVKLRHIFLTIVYSYNPFSSCSTFVQKIIRKSYHVRHHTLERKPNNKKPMHPIVLPTRVISLYIYSRWLQLTTLNTHKKWKSKTHIIGRRSSPE